MKFNIGNKVLLKYEHECEIEDGGLQILYSMKPMFDRKTIYNITETDDGYIALEGFPELGFEEDWLVRLEGLPDDLFELEL